MLKAVPVNGNGHGRGPEPFEPRVDLSPFSPKVVEMFGPFVGEVNLNLGCGRNIEPGFINLDRRPGAGVDHVFDLEACGADPVTSTITRMYRLPSVTDHRIGWQADNSVDCVLASQVLEHIRNLIPLMREIHRVLKPGGFLCISVPYASSDDAWEDPTHVRAFTEKSWAYFDKRLYEMNGYTSSYSSDVDFIFEQVALHLIPTLERQAAAQHAAVRGQMNMLDIWKIRERNVIKEMVVVLRKVAS